MRHLYEYNAWGAYGVEDFHAGVEKEAAVVMVAF